MRAICFFLFLVVFNGLFVSHVMSQQQSTDSIIYAQASSDLFNTYKKEIAQNLQLYNGQEYIRNGQKAKGFPFFESDSLLKGVIYYNGNAYKDVEMYYDMVADEVVVKNYTNKEMIQLVKQLTDSFSVSDHLFVHLIAGKNGALIKEGFYDVLYQGKVTVYVKREKKMELSVKAEDEAAYKQYNDYFLLVENIFYSIDDESSLLNALKDKKELIKKFIKANKISFRKRPEATLITIAGYYTQLKN